MNKRVYFKYGKSSGNMFFDDLENNNIGYYNINIDFENHKIMIGRDPKDKVIYHFIEQPEFMNLIKQFIHSPYEISVCSVWKNKPTELSPIIGSLVLI